MRYSFTSSLPNVSRPALSRWGLALVMTSVLSACGGSSDSGSEDFPDAYIQFYNVSPNSAATSLVIDDETRSSSTYGDTTALYAYESGDYEVELTWEDSDGQESVIYEDEAFNLRDGQKTLLIMGGDFSDPDILEFTFDRSDDLEDEFYLYGMSGINDGATYDLYIGDAGAPFTSANFIANTNYLQPEQMSYWAPDDDEFAWPTGDYVLFLTEPGSQEVIFASQDVAFDFESDYFISIRNTSGANTENVVVDIILNSSNTTAEQDITATAQYRVYSALSESLTVDVAVSDGEEETSITVDGGTLSDFTAVNFGDYQISATSSDTDLSFTGRLLTLNQGDSKTVIIFDDPELGLTSLTMEDSTLPQSVQHEIAVANLLPEFDNLDIYFVRDDETIETAENRMTGLDYAESRDITIPNDFYSVVVVFEDNLGIESLLYRSEVIDFNNEAVYIVTIEPDADTGGYKANVSW